MFWHWILSWTIFTRFYIIQLKIYVIGFSKFFSSSILFKENRSMFILISVQIMVWVYLYVITCSLGGVNQLKMQYMWVQRSHMTPNWGPCYIVGCTLYQVKRPFIVHIHLSGSTDAILKVACNCACLESVQEYYCCVFFYSFFLGVFMCVRFLGVFMRVEVRWRNNLCELFNLSHYEMITGGGGV